MIWPMSIAQRTFLWFGVIFSIYLLNVASHGVVSIYIICYYMFLTLWIELSPPRRFIRLSKLIKTVGIENNPKNNQFYWTVAGNRNDFSKYKKGSAEHRQFLELQSSLMNKIPTDWKNRYEKLLFNHMIDESGANLAIAKKNWFVDSHWNYPMYLWLIPEDLKEKYNKTLDNCEKRMDEHLDRLTSKTSVTNIGWCPSCHSKLNNMFISKCPICTANLK